MEIVARHPHINSFFQTAEKVAPFRAEWPDPLNPELDSCCTKTAKVFWEVISYIIFPIIIIRCLINWVRTLAFKKILLPGDSRYPKEYLNELGEKLLNECHGKKVPLIAPDGAKLDAVFFKGSTHPEKVIFYGFGNGGQWEVCQGMVQRLQQLFGVSILMINPRGVGESVGERYPQGYALDTYTGYEYLIKKQFDLENILFHGHSMGGAYGSCGAALIQEKYPEKAVSMINDRSYSNLLDAGKALVDVECCCCPLNAVIPCLFNAFNTQIDAQKPFESLKGKKCLIYSKNDGVIHYHKASLHKGLVDAGYQNFTAIELTGELPDTECSHCYDHHNRPFNDSEEVQFIQQVEEMLHLEKKADERLATLRYSQRPFEDVAKEKFDKETQDFQDRSNESQRELHKLSNEIHSHLIKQKR